jgi:outer membrane protein TolC
MINKFLILVIALIVANVSFANTSELVLVSHSISKHPKVVEKANEITLKGISVDQILAEDGLKINFSTKSKLPISYDLSTNASRADDLDREFLDGVVTLNKNLYDFGVVEFKSNAEILRKEALKLEYQQVFSTTLQKLLNIVNDVARVKTVLVTLRSDLVKTNASIDEVKLRFTSGIGTVMDVRQAQLSLLDLETEIQTLRRDRDTNLVILRDEFSLSQSDLKLINSAINQFNNKLTANKQDVALVINQSINYQRSVDIINLEKSALNSQIKSLKSENMPQLSASVTGIAYDVTRGLDEYELYGGINLAMPLFDSGLSKVKQRGLTYRIKVQNDMMNALNQDKSLALNKLIKKYKNLQIENNNAVQKQANLTEKLSQIIQRMAVVDEGLLSKLQTQLQLAKIKRDLLAYPYHIKSINIDYWSLNEQLIEKIGIHPTK